MKFKTNDLMVIHGGSVAAPEFKPQMSLRPLVVEDRSQGSASAMLRFPSEVFPSGDAPPTQASDAGDPQAMAGQGGAAAQWVWATSLDVWMPLFRSTDSACLLGEGGVLKVGVNDLGWVVYDWIPGP